MMPKEMPEESLPFRPDFAARVLDNADAVVVRRRRTRWTAAAASAAVVFSLVGLGMWQRPLAPSGAERIPRQTAGVVSGDMDFVRSARMEPLDYMFPDARPLARFLDQYGGTGNALEDDAVFFPDAPDDAAEEVDGS